MFDRKKWRGTGGTARLSAAQRTTNITASLTPANRIKFLRELLPRTVFFLDYLYILHLQGFLHSIRPLLELLDRRSSPPPTTSLISRSLCATQLVSVGCRTTRMRMHPVSIHHRSRDIPWMFTGESRFENMP
jgi:hypothetical protein